MTRLRNEYRAGLFVALSLGLLFISILVMGRERQLFVGQIAYSARMLDTKGLASGAPIRLGGIKVGRVGEIKFPKDPGDREIQVELLINETYVDRIRIDSALSIETQGLLGDRYVSIDGGMGDDRLPLGSLIAVKPSQEISEVMGKVQTIVEDTSVVAKDLSSITGKVKEEGVDKLVKAFDTFNRVLAEVENGKGFAHELVYGSTGKETIQDLRDAARNLKETTSDIREVAKKLSKNDGVLLGLLGLESSKSLVKALESISKASSDIAIISDAISRGTGTIGALIMDSSLYDNTVQLTDEAKRSILLRQALRAAMRSQKGEK